MLYRAKYCNHCGEKIERAEWKFTTSRRFCDLCATDLAVHEWAPRIVTVFFGIAVVMGLGKAIISGSDQATASAGDPPASEARTLAVPHGKNEKNRPEGPTPDSATNSNVPVSSPSVVGDETFRTPKRVENASDNGMFLCGAPTKKGTPCSRKVRSRGYCWQHRAAAE